MPEKPISLHIQNLIEHKEYLKFVYANGDEFLFELKEGGRAILLLRGEEHG